MTTRYLQVFILLTNLWDDGYIGISHVAGQTNKNLIAFENTSVSFLVIMPDDQSPFYVGLKVDDRIFASFHFQSTAAITPDPDYVNSTTVTREINGTTKQYRVVFDPVKGIHAGVVSCVDGLQGGNVIPGCGQDIKITVVRTPDPPAVSILYGSSKIGDDVVFHCPSRSRSLPPDHPLDLKVLWSDEFVNNSNVKNRHRFKAIPGTHHVVLKRVTQADNGLNLRCSTYDIDPITRNLLWSGYGPVFTVRTYTKSKGGCTDYPKLEADEAVVESEEGKAATMLAHLKTCGKLSWHRETLSHPIIHDGYTIFIKYYADSSLLKITDLTQADSGFYICRAVNSYGTEVQLRFQLKVTPKPVPLGVQKPNLTLDDKDNKIIHGHSFTWTCHVKPEWNITSFQWQIINGSEYSSPVEIYTDPGDTITKGKHSAWCRARSGPVWTAKSDLLIFSVIPATPTLTPSVSVSDAHIYIISPTPLTLSCKSVDADIGIFYNFYKDHKTDLGIFVPYWHTEAVTYTVPTLQAEPAAVYTCTASFDNLESLHSSEKIVTVYIGPKTPTLRPSVADSVILVDTDLTLQCYSESKPSTATKNRKTYYHFYRDAQEVRSNTTHMGKYEVPTNQPAPPHNYTCTATWYNTIGESLHSSPHKLTIVVKLHDKPSLIVSNKKFIHGGSFTMTCSPDHEDAVGFLFSYKDSYSPAKQVTKTLTVGTPDIGKYGAKCRFYDSDGNHSPFSDIVEVTVLPKTPTLSASLQEEYIRVNTTLILTCKTLSVGPDPPNYSFYSDNNLVPGSPSSNNTYKVPTSEAFPEVAYTCTVTIASVESLHSSEHRVDVYAPFAADLSTAVVIIIIVVTNGILLCVCILAYMCLRKRRKRGTNSEKSTKASGYLTGQKSGAQSLADRSTQGTGQDIGSFQTPLPDRSNYSGGTYGVLSGKPSNASKAEESKWQKLKGIFTPAQNSGTSDGESSMNYLKSLDGWQSSRANETDVDMYDAQGNEIGEDEWQRLKLKHLQTFIAEHENESLDPQSWQESSLSRSYQGSSLQQDKKQKQADDKQTDSKKVSCWQRCVPRCLRKKSETAHAVPAPVPAILQQAGRAGGKQGHVPVKFQQTGSYSGSSDPSSDWGTSVDLPSYYSGTLQTKTTNTRTVRPTLRSGLTTNASTYMTRNTYDSGRSAHGSQVD